MTSSSQTGWIITTGYILNGIFRLSIGSHTGWMTGFQSAMLCGNTKIYAGRVSGRKRFLPSILPPTQSKEPGHPPEVYAEKLYDALINHDEVQAKKITDSIQSMFDLTTIFFEVFAPCLYKVGDAWYKGEIRIATEHFASALIRGILMNLLQAFPVYSQAPNILIGCAPEEFHEIAPLMLSVLLRREGYQAEFLGADLPVDDLVLYAGDVSPEMIILSAGFEHTARPLFKMQTKLDDLPAKHILGFGGRYFNENPKELEKMQGVFLGNSLDEAIQKVHDLLD